RLARHLECVRRRQRHDYTVVADAVDAIPGADRRRREAIADALLPDLLAGLDVETGGKAFFAAQVNAVALDQRRRQVRDLLLQPPDCDGLVAVLRRRADGDEVLLRRDKAARAEDQISGDDRRRDGALLLVDLED